MLVSRFSKGKSLVGILLAPRIAGPMAACLTGLVLCLNGCITPYLASQALLFSWQCVEGRGEVRMTFLGVPWDGTFAAAVVAALVGVVTLITTSVQADRAARANASVREATLRLQEQSEARAGFESAVNRALSKDKTERRIGVALLRRALDDPRTTREMMETILAVSTHLDDR